MKTREMLLAGASLLAIATAAPANAQSSPTANFVFGLSSATVTATTAYGGSTPTTTAGAITTLSSQVNNALTLDASGQSGAFAINGDTTTTGGPASVANNVMSATAIANQFSGVSGATYTLSPSATPTGGYAVIGTSQLNYNSSATTNTARLGTLGVEGTTTTTTITTTLYSSGTGGTISFAASGSDYTVTSNDTGLTTINGVTVTSGATLTSSEYASVYAYTNSTVTASSYGYYIGNLSNPASFATNSISITGVSSTTTSTTSSTIGGTVGTENLATFTAAAVYGAPVAVDNNTFAARINGNLALSQIAGSLPVGGSVAAGPASVAINGVSSSLAPVGSDVSTTTSTTTSAIVVSAPISVSNVQQNLVSAEGTSLLASAVNTRVSATFTGAGNGFDGGQVSTSGNAISANAAGNNGTVGISLDGAGNPVFGGGLSVLSAQGNNASGSGAGLSVSAENLNSVVMIQAANASGTTVTLTGLTSSNASLNGNSITSRTALNDLNQSLVTAGPGSASTTVFAGGSNASSSPTAMTIRPITDASVPTLTATADYLNMAMQSNVADASGGTVTGAATTGNAVIGFFGGVSNGTVTVQRNTVSATAQGNAANVGTSLGWVDPAAQTATGLFQNNDRISIEGTLADTQFRISDQAALTTDLSTSTYSSVAPASSGSTYTNANLAIGSATTPALGNAASVLVIGNNGVATSTLGQATLGSAASLTTASMSVALGSDPSASPAGSTVTVTAPTSTVLVQQNLNLGDLHAHVTQANAWPAGNYLYQIDAYQGLSSGTATIGNNAARATAAGNLGQVASTVGGATSNAIGGGVGVLSVQGNQGGNIEASLGGLVTDASTSTTSVTATAASIGVGSLTSSNAQIVNNTFAALAVGNSATGQLTIPSGTIAGGTDPSGSQFNWILGSDPTLTANYAMGNYQTNAGTTLSASNIAAGSGIGSVMGALGSGVVTNGVFAGGMTAFATDITNSTLGVTGNTVSANVVGNEYIGQASGVVSPGVSGGTYTSLAVANGQLNTTGASGTTATTGTAINVGNAFAVGLADTPALATEGSVLASSGGTVSNSVLQVANNTASAGVTMNSSRLSALGLGTSGVSAEGGGATVSGSLGTSSITTTSSGPATVTNVQANILGSTSTSTGTGALTALNAFSVNWNGVGGSNPTASNFLVNGNAATASVMGNDATLAASIAAGTTFAGGVGLNNVQVNSAIGSSGTSGTTFTSVAMSNSFTAGVDVAVDASAGTLTPSATGGGVRTENSVVSVSNNRMTADTTLNQAAFSLSNPTGTLVQGGFNPASESVVSATGASADATATIAVANTQMNVGVNAMAMATGGIFLANASSTDGVVSVNGNQMQATARGNTASVSLDLPRVDGSVEAFNAQTTANSTIMAEGGQSLIGAASANSRTENTPVSVNNNLASASATVNNYAATLSGLGQTSAASAAGSSLSVTNSSGTLTATRTSGDVALVSAQAIDTVTATAVQANNLIGIALANVTSGTTGSPLSVNLNSVTATANGNVSAQTLLANGAGDASSRGGFGVVNAQQIGGSTLSATAEGTNIAVTASASLPTGTTVTGATSTVINSPVTVSGNTVGSAVNGNSASLGIAFANTLRAGGTGSNATSSVAAAGSSTAVADYSLLNYQTTSGSAFNAQTTATSIGFTGVAATSPVNVQGNLVYANAFGNSGTMSLTAPLAGGSMQSTNYQSNTGSSVLASVSGTSMAATLATGASTFSPVNVTGNQIRAVAVGNSVANQIGR